MSTAMKKRGPAPVKRNEVIMSLREKKVATSRDLGADTAYLISLRKQGFIEVAGKQEEKAGKGRKSYLWKLSRKGNGKALSLSRQLTAA
jgi:predicted ArsR family transcriptional regulator